MQARHNPFRTERLEALSFRFLDGDWPQLWARLTALGGRAAIVGPRGSGKTTLLCELARRLPARGVVARVVHAPAPDRASPAFWPTVEAVIPGEALLVDGAERLSFLAWRRLRAASRRAAALIVTQHRAHRLPALLHTRTNPALLTALVGDLVGPPGAALDLPALFAETGGDLRRALLALYDRCS